MSAKEGDASVAPALTAEQQESLNEKKVQLRMENERYLREHPELSQVLDAFFKKTLMEKPDNIEQFAAEF
eukprot:CAMPEP_0184557140 /NCGR_PEP_ID=MMETSP0199_2-20130426/41975_1 /TAXON_ID=1112570 /ORGANISM="Thraustochytrium sp., Strain LLF1b" /LENGTH=69 /DNA_ID=CAMNT_0026953983 /DNA_START=205 /DNA_END=411 /DNA_ORIENTATION=+